MRSFANKAALRMALAGAVLLLLSGCMRYNEVKLLGVQGAQLTRLDGKGLSVIVLAEVSNPNKYKISLSDPDVDLYLNDRLVGKAVLDSTVVLAANTTRTYRVPLHTDFSQDGNLLPMLLSGALSGSMKVGAKGSIVAKARLLHKRFPFEAEQQIDLR
ncbi:MAG: LEA type 2 family protein [Bacteroidetes bacterium]|nr:LEA type 2 family protein [Bacteroidota bacterium]